MTFPAELTLHINAISRLIYYVTPEEDRFLAEFHEKIKDSEHDEAWVFTGSQGLHPLNTYVDDWKTKKYPESKERTLQQSLKDIYKRPTNDARHFYIVLDPEKWLRDIQLQRQVLDVVHQGHQDLCVARSIIFVSSTLYVPEKLSRYIEVVTDKGLTEDEALAVVTETCEGLKMEIPPNPLELFKGMTGYEIQASLIQSFKAYRGFANEDFLRNYKFSQLKKTNLLEHVPVKETFANVGGVERFKKWAEETAPAWTEEGRAFGLEPPKGVLAVGVWGTGKSISIKSLAAAWGLPMLHLDMGKLRSSGVGDSEANTYRVISIIESMAPCLVWIDEAEKSLAGGESSAKTDGGTGSRMIGALSTWHQETKAPVCLAMTANSLATLPVEFINRTDERWFFGLPEKEDRIAILKIHLEKRSKDPADYNLARLAEAAENMVGREIEQSIKSAMRKSFAAGHKTLDEDILHEDLNSRPRIVTTMVDDIDMVTKWVGYDENAQDGVNARYAAGPKKGSKFSAVV